MAEETKKLISHQLKIGGLNDGDTVYVKLAMDGTNITKKEVATAATITLSNETRALSLGTISIVMTGESYEVIEIVVKDCLITESLKKIYKTILKISTCGHGFVRLSV